MTLAQACDVTVQFIRASWLIFLLLLLTLLSGLSLGYVSYENRRLNNLVQQELEQRNRAQMQWSKLLLEHSTLTSPARIEQIAREELDMDVPTNDQIEMVLP